MFELQNVILVILAVFMLIGAFDKILGNRYGYGEAFERGFSAMGPIAIVMIGMISLAPVLADVLRPIVVPVYQWLGADPAMFATSLLALDMGGYALAGELAETKESARFAGILLGTTLGPTLTFTIPVALSILKKDDHPIFAKGILAGITTIPLGLLAGGIAAGFSIIPMIANLIPILLFSCVIILGLVWKPNVMVKGFQQFGKGVVVFTTMATAVVVFEALSGWTIISGMAPSEEGILTLGSIAFTLAGAFPLVHFLQKHWTGTGMGKRFFMDNTAISGWLASLAHIIPMFAIKGMTEEGKWMNYAFAVSGAFILGGHLAFTAAVERDMIVPMLIGKGTGGLSAMVIAYWMIKKRR
ncbi:ethanolamine transporter [Salibacterium salarium]|uniref:ethanolamine utilization protein EutH n=1 Tax=Salibacterium salarium TaxID=284579 RepID=UPI002785FC94|nr:ethanolamine utilization protein EutH [Salibacterium salarium]MDQ0300330.1 ethanolamine transporter [Salibacterium salarium]